MSESVAKAYRAALKDRDVFRIGDVVRVKYWLRSLERFGLDGASDDDKRRLRNARKRERQLSKTR